MTPTSDVPGTGDHEHADHPEATEISALGEGLLTPARSEEVTAHLAQCPLCADVRDALSEIQDMLGALPGPARMPDDIAGRIDAALAAEATLPSGGARDESSVSRETEPVSRETAEREAPAPSAAEPSVRRPRPAPRHTPHATDRPPGHPSSGSTRAPSGPGRTGRARRWRTALLATAGALAALGLGSMLIVQGGSGDSKESANADSSTSQERPSYDGSGKQQKKQDGGDGAADLGPRVRALLDAQGEPSPAPEVGTKQSPSGQAPMESDDSTVPSCVREGIGRSEKPLAADPNTPYQGQPAYLVVLPHAGDSRFVDAYVVDPACTTGATTGPGEVLTKHTYARE